MHVNLVLRNTSQEMILMQLLYRQIRQCMKTKVYTRLAKISEVMLVQMNMIAG